MHFNFYTDFKSATTLFIVFSLFFMKDFVFRAMVSKLALKLGVSVVVLFHFSPVHASFVKIFDTLVLGIAR